MAETPGSQGRPGCGRRPDPAKRGCFSSQGWLWKGNREACVRRRRHEDVRNVSSFVRLGTVEVNPVTRRLQIVFVVET